MTWKRGQITLAMGRVDNGRRVQTSERVIDGWTWRAFGIAKQGRLDWYVTHLPTGYFMGGMFPSKAMAQQFCGEIAELTDWATLDVPAMRITSASFRDAFFAAAERARWGEKVALAPTGGRA